MSTELKTLNGYGFDATKLGGLDAQYYAQGRAAHNLLDNSDFTNPVNQRGRSGTYEGVSNYTTFVIDRWETWSTGCTYTLSSAGLQIANLNASFSIGPWEKLPNPERMKGKTYTLAVGYNGGSVVCGNVAVPTGTLTEDKYLSAVSASGTRPGVRFVITSNYSHIDFQIMISAGQTVTVEWAALYEGSYTADTLPDYAPKGYAAELAECQRYYRRFDEVASGFFISANGLQVEMPLNPPMRVAPTVTSITSPSAYTANGKVDVSGSYASTASKTKAGYVYYSPTAVPVGTPAVVSGMIAELSADL